MNKIGQPHHAHKQFQDRTERYLVIGDMLQGEATLQKQGYDAQVSH